MSDAIFLAVFNALWQGAALVAGVSLAMRLGVRRNATTACLVWSATFAVVAALPLLDLALARPVSAAPKIAPAVLTAIVPVRATAFAETRASDEHPAFAQPHAVPAIDGVHAASLRVGGIATGVARTWGLAILSAWALISGVLLLRLARAYGAMARLKRNAVPLADRAIGARLRAAGHRRHAAIASSADVAVPCAIGFRRPMILLPASLVASLEHDDLARVVLHESAHLQRYDDWLNAFEHAMCALQFFQPALHLASRRIDFEREVACDDRVLCDAGEPLRYAECLARIVERHVRGRRAAVVPGFVLGHAQVVARVRRIVDRSRDASPRLRVPAVTAAFAVLMCSFGIARLQVPVVAAASAAPLDAPAPAAAVPSDELPQRVAPAPAVRPAPAARTAAPARAATHPATHPATHAATHAAAHPAAVVHAATRPIAAVKPAVARATSVPPVPAAEAAPARVASARPPAADAGEAPVAHAPSAVAQVEAVPPAPPEPPVPASPFPRTGVRVVVPIPMARINAIVHAHVTAGGDLLDAIDEARYPRPSVDELIALRNQGVSGNYVRAMGAIGRGRPSLHDLISLAVQGVSAEYVATLDRRLAVQPTIDQIVALRAQGVSARWLDALAAAGYPKLSVNDAVALAVQGVSSSYVRGLLAAGLRDLSAQQIISLMAQGVDSSFVRRLAQHGYRNLSIDEIVRLKASGFEP